MVQWVFREKAKCRGCRSTTLVDVLNLGDLHISSFPGPDEPDSPRVPLDVVRCEKCGLVQLRHTTNPELLYRTYWYRSGTNQTMRTALAEICQAIERSVELHKGDVVVDIGCNDGTLLSSYAVPGLKRVGFEPASNVAAVAREIPDVLVIDDYFQSKAPLFGRLRGKAKAVTSIALFYDLDDPHSFIRDVDSILAENGLWIIQIAHLPSMLARNAFDGICHEHLEYYSLYTIQNLLRRNGFEIFDAELVELNEGSIRLYVWRAHEAPKEISNARVKNIQALESAQELGTQAPYLAFAKHVAWIRERATTFIEDAVRSGKKVHAYGASTKGNTLIQYFGLSPKLVECVWERQSQKWGRQTVGSRIPIVSEAEGRKMNPDYLLMLPWHFASEFLKRESAYLANGGKFIIPIPKFEVV
jgi:hypothetical protein